MLRSSAGMGSASATTDELVDLTVDDPLEDDRLPDEGEDDRVVLALHVDDQSPGGQHAIPQRLRQAEARYPLESDLDDVAIEHVAAHENPGRGQSERVEAPSREANEEPRPGDRGQYPQSVGQPARDRRLGDDDGDHDRHRRHGDEEWAGKEDPVRAQLDQHLLVVVEVPPRQRHAPESTCDPMGTLARMRRPSVHRHGQR